MYKRSLIFQNKKLYVTLQRRPIECFFPIATVLAMILLLDEHITVLVFAVLRNFSWIRAGGATLFCFDKEFMENVMGDQ